MKLAERHRINPRKKKEPKKERPSSIKLRRKGIPDEPSVLYINKSVYVDRASPSDERAEDFLKRINDKHSLKIVDDADSMLGEIFKRGWKVRHIELSIGRTYLIRFFRDIGEDKSRVVIKKDKSLKKLLLRALEHILKEERGRYHLRMKKVNRRQKSI